MSVDEYWRLGGALSVPKVGFIVGLNVYFKINEKLNLDPS